MKTRCSQVLVIVLHYSASGLSSNNPLFNPCLVLLPIMLQTRMTWNYLLSPLAKVLRGRTLPRQNREIGASCVNSLPFCNDNFTLDSLHLRVPKCLLQLCIALDLPSVFQGAHAVSCCLTPLWLYNFPAQKMLSGFPRGARQSRFSLLFFWVLTPTVPAPQYSTASESLTLPFLCLYLFHALPFVWAGLHLSSPSMEILIIFQGSTHLYVPTWLPWSFPASLLYTSSIPLIWHLTTCCFVL